MSFVIPSDYSVVNVKVVDNQPTVMIDAQRNESCIQIVPAEGPTPSPDRHTLISTFFK